MAEEINDDEPEIATSDSDEEYDKFTFNVERREWSKL